jgi:HTH-type transcriptional regulator, sugar sensing transcriptional regulator
MNKILKDIGLSENESKVYTALLKLKKGTKTPIVKESKILSSKVYEVLDRLIEKGLVAYYVENKVKHFIPVHPENIGQIFDNKIKKIKENKEIFENFVKSSFISSKKLATDVQIFRGWKGFGNAFNLLISDLKLNDTYYILGASGGEDVGQALINFSKTNELLDKKRIKRKAVHRLEKKEHTKIWFKEHSKKYWNIRYNSFPGPFEIGITNNYVVLILLEKEPFLIVIHNKSIRDSFLNYFNTIWKAQNS